MFADGGGLREPLASSSPPRWGGGELRAGVTPVLRKGIDIRAADCGGSRNERMQIAGLRAPRLRPAQFKNRDTSKLIFGGCGGRTEGASRRR